jgi:hypothetical protein
MGDKDQFYNSKVGVLIAVQPQHYLYLPANIFKAFCELFVFVTILTLRIK